MKVIEKSHVDHLPRRVIDAAIAQIGQAMVELAKSQVVIAQVRIPGAQLPCGLYGPAMGDAAVDEAEVRYAKRPGRDWASRLVDRPMRPSDLVTLVCGPYEGEAVLYTAYAGAEAPREVNDPNADEASQSFWAEHALVAEAV
jgi:hypothetical protein